MKWSRQYSAVGGDCTGRGVGIDVDVDVSRGRDCESSGRASVVCCSCGRCHIGRGRC